MPETPTPSPDATPDPAPPALVDTSPSSPERTGVTYGILFIVLAALTAYFVVRLSRH